MVCYIYLLVTFQTDALLDKDVILNNQDRIASVERKKKCLMLASIVVVLLSLAVAVMYGIGFTYIYHKRGPRLLIAAMYLSVASIGVFLAIWALALAKLYNKVKNQEALLPNKKVFLLHGISLFLLVFFLSMNIGLQEWGDNINQE